MSPEQLKHLTYWSWVISLLLVLAVCGSLWAARQVAPPEQEHCRGCGGSVVVKVDGGDRNPEPPPPPHRSPLPGVVFDLDVNAVAAPPSAGGQNGPGNAGPGTTQTVTVSGAPVTLRSSPAGSATNIVASPGGANAVPEKEKPAHPLCTNPDVPAGTPGPCATAEFLDRVEFEEDSRRIHSSASEADRIAAIAGKLGGRTGIVLVIGHEDSCGASNLARRRARKARRALRRLLKSSAEWRSGAIRIHTQAAGEDPGAPEAACARSYFGSAGVYLIEGLQ